MRSAGLQIAPEKSELVIFSGKRRIQQIAVTVGDTQITAKKSLKYLGVILDKNLTFREHLQSTKEKAHRMIGALGRLMHNKKGPNTHKRRILAAVAASPILYATKTWYGALKYKSNLDTQVKAQRPAAIKVARCYKTTSTAAALVVGGVPPLHLQAKSRVLGEGKSKKCRRQALLEEWQKEWDSGTTGRWTRRLIPDLRLWVERKHGEVGHYMAQALTGHGCFRSYLKRIGKRTSDTCTTCNTSEDAAHVLFDCARWDHIRPARLQGRNGIEEVMNLMLQDSESWDRVDQFVREALSSLEREDRLSTTVAANSNT